MLKIFSSILASLPIVSACGSEHAEEAAVIFGFMNFGFTGGLISTLIVISLALSIALLTKKLNLWR